MDYLAIRNKILTALLIVGVTAVFVVYLSQPIVLTAVDIGRHIKNGELLLRGETSILFTNFYSFTYPDYSFVNHHWFFGVLSFWVYQWGGFTGLSYAYLAVMALALIFYLDTARLLGNIKIGLLLAVLFLPVLVDRREIRPEGISVLMMGLYLWCAVRLGLREADVKWTAFILLVAQIIWVNTHIFFFMGPLIILLFAWRQRSKQLLWLALGLIGVSAINPSGIKGMFTPLNIFNEFGYRLAENQHVFFMMNRFSDDHVYKLYIAMVIVMLIGIVMHIILHRKKSDWALLVLLVIVLLAGLKAVRLMNHAAFFVLPIGAYLWNDILRVVGSHKQRFLDIILSVMVIMIGSMYGASFPAYAGVGLSSHVNRSAEFYKINGLKGPIFSNYDIGGYLIFHLAPDEKVFVDNRQEAFPVKFFKDVYIPMQENNQVWQEVDGQYNFQVIYFFRHDLTPWGQQLMINRIDDPDWAPVFVDDYTIIFVKRNGVNQGLIPRYELPKSMFKVSVN